MTLHEFDAAVASAEGIDVNDRIWFPRWLRRYALSFTKSLTNPLPVNRDTTLNYSRQLLEAGAPAWQRWQAVRSLECYRQIARATQRHQPDLEERFDEVYWPVALSRSYPSRQRLRDKRSGNRWRPG